MVYHNCTAAYKPYLFTQTLCNEEDNEEVVFAYQLFDSTFLGIFSHLENCDEDFLPLCVCARVDSIIVNVAKISRADYINEIFNIYNSILMETD